MDFEMLVVFSFLLMCLLVVCGVILLFPLSRKLGLLIEARIEEKKVGGGASTDEIRQLARRLDGIESQLESLGQRQEFLDRLLAERGSPEALPAEHRPDAHL